MVVTPFRPRWTGLMSPATQEGYRSLSTGNSLLAAVTARPRRQELSAMQGFLGESRTHATSAASRCNVMSRSRRRGRRTVRSRQIAGTSCHTVGSRSVRARWMLRTRLLPVKGTSRPSAPRGRRGLSYAGSGTRRSHPSGLRVIARLAQSCHHDDHQTTTRFARSTIWLAVGATGNLAG